MSDQGQKTEPEGGALTSTMTPEFAVSLIKDFMQKITDEKHCRYLSWEHCYKAFSDNRKAIADQRKAAEKGTVNSNTTDAEGEEVVDKLALNLAFYLASWGMYRGSSFLLQTDYKIHVPVVRLIQNKSYDSLHGVDAKDLANDECPEHVNLVMELSDKIRAQYAEFVDPRDGEQANATDILVTKILMGTLGCTPAYDRYYTASVKKHKISTGTYTAKSLRAVANFYCAHSDVFESLKKELKRERGIKYPPMKLMDMCFWQDGFIEDLKERKEKEATTTENNE